MNHRDDLSFWDEHLDVGATDHQETPGTNFREHIKEVVRAMRAGFPDLHFEVQHILAEGEIVAFHSTMTGTHEGVFALGPFRDVPPTGRRISVRHMHFLRVQSGKTTDLWHLWDTPALLRQLGVTPSPRPLNPSKGAV